MNIKKITIKIACVAVAVAAVLPFNAVLAQSPSVQAARDTVQKKDAVAANDFTSRLSTAVSIVDLTSAEATDTISKLDPLTQSTDPVVAHAATTLLPLVRGYHAYSTLLQTQLRRPTLSDEQLSLIAGSLGEWRKTIYEPGMRQALNVILLAQGDDVLRTAERRFEKVKADVITLQRLFGAKANVLVADLDLAKRHIAHAQDSFEAGHEVFVSDQDAFMLHSTTGVVGTLTDATFARGTDGDFTCVLQPTKENPTACVSAFKTGSGLYYLLVNTSGIALSQASMADVYRVSGAMVTIKPIFTGDALVGVLFVNEINRAQPKPVSNNQTDSDSATANILDNILSAVPAKTMQAYISDEIAYIGKAYQQFLAMSKIAKALTSSK